MHAHALRLVHSAQPANRHNPVPRVMRRLTIALVGSVQAFAWSALLELALRVAA